MNVENKSMTYHELSLAWWYDSKNSKQINLTLKASIAYDLNVASFHLLLLQQTICEFLADEGFVNGEALKIWKGDASCKNHPHVDILCTVVLVKCCLYEFRGSKILAQPWLHLLCTNRTYNLHEKIWRSLANNFVGTNFWGYKCDLNKYDKRERTQPIVTTPNCTCTEWSTISLVLL